MSAAVAAESAALPPAAETRPVTCSRCHARTNVPVVAAVPATPLRRGDAVPTPALRVCTSCGARSLPASVLPEPLPEPPAAPAAS